MIIKENDNGPTVWWLLKKIKSEMGNSPQSNIISLSIDVFFNETEAPGGADQLDALYILFRKKALGYTKLTETGDALVVIGLERYNLSINQPIFEEIFEEYAKRFNGNGKKSKVIIHKSKPDVQHSTLELSLNISDCNLLKERLHRKYQSFVQHQNGGFFIGIAEYIKMVVDSPVLCVIVEASIIYEQTLAHQKLNELLTSSQKELETVARQLRESVRTKNIQCLELNPAIQEYNDYKFGRRIPITMRYPITNEFDSLCDIVRAFKDVGHIGIIKDYVKVDEQGLIEKFTFAPTFRQFCDEEAQLNRQRRLSVWGSWQELYHVYYVIFNARDEFRKIKELNDTFKMVLFQMTAGAMLHEMDGILDKRNTHDNVVYFIKDNYTPHINRLHDHLLTKLDEFILKLSKAGPKDMAISYGQVSEHEKNEELKDLRQSARKNQPLCVTEGKWGFLKFGKHGKKIKIGKSDSKPFKLLQAVLVSFPSARTEDSLFEAIRSTKDKHDSRLTDPLTSRQRKMQLIKYAIKELQKNNKLQGKLKFQFDGPPYKIWVELIE